MKLHPLAEVFGFPIDNLSDEANRYRRNRLCPYSNRVPNCTKDKADNPLGVCSIFDGDEAVITCPVRFRQDWIIAEDAAQFFFPSGANWTSLKEVRLNNKYGRSAGNIDVVLVAYDEAGHIKDFSALEVQAVYISGNVRRPFEFYMENPQKHHDMEWKGKTNYPNPDYLSSSRKRLAPQLIYKGGILNAWGRKIAVALNRGFYETLPALEETHPSEADIAWMIYDLVLNKESKRYTLNRHKLIYTKFHTSLDQITKSEPGEQQDFIDVLQEKLKEELDNNQAPDVHTLNEAL